jgi:hypothetical protein
MNPSRCIAGLLSFTWNMDSMNLNCFKCFAVSISHDATLRKGGSAWQLKVLESILPPKQSKLLRRSAAISHDTGKRCLFCVFWQRKLGSLGQCIPPSESALAEREPRRQPIFARNVFANQAEGLTAF